MSDAGELIVFEGADGTGKTAISTAVCAEIRKGGLIAELLTFPGKAPHTLGELVYRMHHNSKAVGIQSLTPLSLQALHIAAHLDAIETKVLPLLKQGNYVMLDRFWWSTFVYGVADGVNRGVLNALIQAEKFFWAQHSPRMLFYVTRSNPLRDEPAEKWRRWNEIYRELVISETGQYPIHVIENEDSLDTAVSRVLSLINSK